MYRLKFGLMSLFVFLVSLFASVSSSFASGGISSITSLNLSRQAWGIYGSAVGTLSNPPIESIPSVVPASVFLRASTSAGTSFGFAQYLSGVPARFAKIMVRSSEPFSLYFMVRASDGLDYFVAYSESSFRPASSGGIRYSIAPNFFNLGTQGAWQSLLVDLESDLKVNFPGRSVVSVSRIAVRGQLDIGQLLLFSPADLGSLDLVAGAQSPNLSLDDFDGDSRSNTLELSTGNMFRPDTDGDGISDVAEAADSCGRGIMRDERTFLAGDTLDPDQDGVPNSTENFLGANCHVSDVFALPQFTGSWALYASPADSVIRLGQDGALTFTHSNANPIQHGMLSLGWDSNLAINRERMSFSVKTAEEFVYFVRVKGTNGQLFYLTYQPGTGPSARSGEYISVRVGNASPDMNGYTTYSRNMSDDLAAFLPGVKVAKVLYVCIRGRLSIKDMFFYAPQIATVSPATTAPGDTLQIAGTTFGATGTVTIGGIVLDPGDINSWSDTLIEVVVPATHVLGSHEVIVTSGNLKSNPVNVTLALPPQLTLVTLGDPTPTAFRLLGARFGASGSADCATAPTSGCIRITDIDGSQFPAGTVMGPFPAQSWSDGVLVFDMNFAPSGRWGFEVSQSGMWSNQFIIINP